MSFNPPGLRTFLIICAGQTASMIGTGMTQFAIMIWAYQQTERATTLALLGFFAFASSTLVGLIAGVWVDRWDRRWTMIGGDLGAGIITLILLAFYTSGKLQIWHLFAAEALSGAFSAFQWPAYNAAMTLLVPRKQLVRANALRTLGLDASRILAPALAGLTLRWIDLGGVMLIDTATFLCAVGSLLLIRIPTPPPSEESEAAAGETRWQTFTFGLRYIVARRGLLSMLILYALINLYAGLTWFGLLSAMVLARSGGSEPALSIVQSALGIGGVLGGVVLTIWGGPKRQVHGMLGIAAMSFLLGDMQLGVGRGVPMWVSGTLLGSLAVPYIISSNRSIWQAKVPPDIQGRVLGIAMTLQSATTPIGFLFAGPLADHIFEPTLMEGGALAGIFGPLVGTGPGAGMGLIFVMTATLGALTCASGYLVPALRNVERDLPDYDAVPLSPEIVPDTLTDTAPDTLSSVTISVGD
ncbi:MAG: MFS transporter [Anaerolineae bacterium]|nr:MFS transporter [Anaerolineae bacterium]